MEQVIKIISDNRCDVITLIKRIVDAKPINWIIKKGAKFKILWRNTAKFGL